ncbi:MAG: serine/threonine protein kinase [Erysipelotrichaceae bacterium]|nr:serine/threonine protein kinase [Erysipelotrichaceae bacterium]
MSIELYQRVKILKEDKNKSIYLVKNEIDQLLYIERIYHIKEISVYQKLKSLDLPHIPKIFDIYQQDNKAIIIEEYINQQTLDWYILNHELDRNQCNEIIIQLCDTLSILHQHQIIHRDIKPENIFYDGKQVTLFDFDISRIYDDHQNKDTTILGSYGYAAPEQFGFEQTDNRSDIFSLGVLWNVMLTGKFPSDYVSERWDGWEKDIIDKATKLDRDNRYQSVDDLKDAIMNHKLYYETSWALPGFRNHSKLLTKILAGSGYVLILYMCFVCDPYEATDPTWTYMMDCVFRIVLFIMCLCIIAFIFNYRGIWNYCIFHKNENKIINYIGVMITCCIVVAAIFFLSAFMMAFL